MRYFVSWEGVEPMSEPNEEKCTCRRCDRSFVPSFAFDFYPDGDDPNVGLCERCMLKELFDKQEPHGDPSPLPPGYVDGVCKKGQSKATCSFLGMTTDGFRCLKSSSLEKTIRQRLEEGAMVAKGDNCSGPSDFKPNS
jgi:hypothetical protein